MYQIVDRLSLYKFSTEIFSIPSFVFIENLVIKGIIVNRRYFCSRLRISSNTNKSQRFCKKKWMILVEKDWIFNFVLSENVRICSGFSGIRVRRNDVTCI